MPAGKIVQRFDLAEMRSPVVTDEGYLKADAYVTRSGIFEYQMWDGSIRREFRPEEEVFSTDSLATLKEIPVTNDHPWCFVNSENSKDYTVGLTNDSVEQDGSFVKLGMTILDKNAVHDVVVMKKQELSCGYTCEVWDQKGVWNGMEYDAVQKNIRYNHVAIVDQGRAGPDVKIKVDAAIMVLKKDNGGLVDSRKDESQNAATNKGKSHMPFKIRVDAEVFEVENELAAHKINAKLDAQVNEIADLKKSNSELEAKKDSLNAEIEKAKAAMPKREDVLAEARQRIDLENFAKSVLGDVEKIDSITDSDLKKQIIKNQKPTIELEGKTDDYVSAMFDIVKADFSGQKSDEDNVKKAFEDKVTNSNNKEDSIHDVWCKTNVLNANLCKKSA